MDTADSREEEAKKLTSECQAAHEQWQRQATPAQMNISPAGMEGSLYPNWQRMQDTKPKGAGKGSPYKMPKDEAMKEKISLEEELDAKSVFDPLAPSSELSEAPGSQPRDEASPGSDVAGPKTPPYFSETPISILPFDVSILDIPNKSAALSPVMDCENALLNLLPGLPVKGVEPSRIGCVSRGSGHSSGTGSVMSIRSPAGTSLGVTLRIRARASMPTLFKDRQSSPLHQECPARQDDIRLPAAPHPNRDSCDIYGFICHIY